MISEYNLLESRAFKMKASPFKHTRASSWIDRTCKVHVPTTDADTLVNLLVCCEARIEALTSYRLMFHRRDFATHTVDKNRI